MLRAMPVRVVGVAVVVGRVAVVVVVVVGRVAVEVMQ
jgi:hypothetical protein